LMALCSAASFDMTVKMVVPICGNLDGGKGNGMPKDRGFL
jgi:hypothetical protein